MERRLAQRERRRLRVIFTDLATGDKRQGFTANLSSTGVFVASAHILSPGTRVRLEIENDGKSVILDGRVARVARVPPALRSVQREGMGVNFIQVADLVSQLIPQPDRRTAQAQKTHAQPLSPPQPPASRPSPVPQRQAAAPVRPANEPPAGVSPLAASGSTTAPLRRPGAFDTARQPAPLRPAWGHYQVEFHEIQELRCRFEEELRFGGMFVAAQERPRLDETITLDLTLPGAQAPIRLSARVVHLPTEEHTGARGFAVAFDNRRSVIETIKAKLGEDPPVDADAGGSPVRPPG